ncbi:hypothetical protein BDN70DRAFT_882712 [Pholiota conissans]|uniref:DUF7918 domain-containing protein n=1 Tax=Pholiota conissans TaxID=109636 RepID=A0A9P5YYB3_9AGAR|nr:hypothetical protein BDN70DRAFT_882712 [Pholiota conissans]
MSTSIVRDRLSCSGFEVWININGVKAATYEVEHEKSEKEERTSCWIASVADTEFSVSFHRKEYDEYDYASALTLDGLIVDDSVYLNSDDSTSEILTLSTYPISRTEETNFVFGHLESIDDDNTQSEDLSTQNIGEIKVVIQRVKAVFSSRSKKITYNVLSAKRVDERSHKALSHQIKNGQIYECEYNDPETYDCVNQGDAIIFTFKYRPLEMLQATGVAPRSVSPEICKEVSVPASHTSAENASNLPNIKQEHSDGESDSEEEDVKEMLAKAHELLAKIESTRSKRRAKKEAGRAKKKVKTEPTTNHFIPGEVIDLT